MASFPQGQAAGRRQAGRGDSGSSSFWPKMSDQFVGGKFDVLHAAERALQWVFESHHIFTLDSVGPPIAATPALWRATQRCNPPASTGRSQQLPVVEKAFATVCRDTGPGVLPSEILPSQEEQDQRMLNERLACHFPDKLLLPFSLHFL